MSRVAISLIIGSIFLVTLSQNLARNAPAIESFTASQAFLAFGLLYCVTKVYINWLGPPRPHKVEDDEDQQNEK